MDGCFFFYIFGWMDYLSAIDIMEEEELSRGPGNFQFLFYLSGPKKKRLVVKVMACVTKSTSFTMQQFF